MSITRWNSKVHTDFNFEDSVYHYEHKEGEYVLFSDHLLAVESLEYDIRYEREQKEEAEHERDFYKKLCEDNLDMSDVEF